MIKASIFILGIMLSPLSGAKVCNINSYSKLLIIDAKNLLIDDVIQKSTCSISIQKKFLEMVRFSSGELKEFYLAKVIKESIINLTPKKINIQFLKELLPAGLNNTWDKIHSLNDNSIIKVSGNESLKTECQNCGSTGVKNIKLTVSNLAESSERIYWFSAKKLKLSLAYVLKSNKNIMTATPLSKHHLKLKYIKTLHPEKIFSKIENLKYYKLNKTLKEGQYLKINDLYPIPIVKVGDHVNITYITNGITLSGKATSLSHGKIGDQIRLRNKKNNKILFGKIIDFNKVIIVL